MEKLHKLVLAAQANDKAAYDTLMSYFQDMAYATAYNYLGDYYLAQDAVQDALLEAFIHLPQLKDPEAFPGWFRQIVFRQCTRITRRASFVTTFSLEDAEVCIQSNPERIVEQREIQRYVHDAIRLLPERERRVTVLFYIYQYSQQEISALLSISLNMVKKRLYLARQRLKKGLEAIIQDGIAVVYYAWLYVCCKEDLWKTNHQKIGSKFWRIFGSKRVVLKERTQRTTFLKYKHKQFCAPSAYKVM